MSWRFYSDSCVCRCHTTTKTEHKRYNNRNSSGTLKKNTISNGNILVNSKFKISNVHIIQGRQTRGVATSPPPSSEI